MVPPSIPHADDFSNAWQCDPPSTAMISANKNGMAPQRFPCTTISSEQSPYAVGKHTKNNKLTQNTLPHICKDQLQWLSHFPGP
jgi:hypothetical protein